MRHKYAREAKTPPHTIVQTTSSSSPMGTSPISEDIVFTETDASWVHHPHEDTLVITTKITNSRIHQVLLDSGSLVNILYWNAYQKVRSDKFLGFMVNQCRIEANLRRSMCSPRKPKEVMILAALNHFVS